MTPRPKLTTVVPNAQNKILFGVVVGIHGFRLISRG